MNRSRFSIQKKLDHLGPEELRALALDYYSDASIKDLKEKYSFSGITVDELHLGLPLTEDPEHDCPYCEVSLFRNAEPRKKSIFSSQVFPFCSNCGHELSDQCQCQNCVKEQKRREELETERKRSFLIQFIDVKKYKPVEVSILNLRQKVFLGTFLRGLLKGDFSTVKPICGYSGKLFPTDELMRIAYNDLSDARILEISPQSDLQEFTPNYEENNYSYKWRNVQHLVNLKGDGQTLDEIISEILNPGVWEEANTDEAVQLWKDISYHECLDLFTYRMEAYDFTYKVGKETKALFEDLIKHFPISQTYSLIWNAAKNAAAYYQEGKVPKQQAANSVVQRMRGAADKVIAGQWQRYEYNRPKECPQSILSEYFFNSVLKVCDQNWWRIPSIVLKGDEEVGET